MRVPALLLWAGLAGAGFCALPTDPAAADEPRIVSLATGGVGGVYHPVGRILARLWSREISGVEVRAEPSFASVTNMLMIQAGVSDLAMVQNDIAGYAYNAQEMFAHQPAASRSRGLTVLYPEPVQIISSAVWRIDSVEDLAGKRVAVGPVGSGTEVNARQILAAHGLDYDDIAEYFLPIEEAAVALRDRTIHAAFVTAGVPTGAIGGLTGKHEHAISIVSIAPEIIEALVERWPQYQPARIPAGTYPGLVADVQTVAVSAMLVATDHLEPELVQRMLEVLFREDTLARLCHSHLSTCRMSRETATEGMSVPLHPGAQDFLQNRVGVGVH